MPNTSTKQKMLAAGKVALVTGATGGLGYDIVKRLAQDGFTVVATATTDKNCQQILANAQSDGLTGVHALPLNVTNEDSVQTLIRTVDEQFARLDVLVNNAGIARYVSMGRNLWSLTPHWPTGSAR